MANWLAAEAGGLPSEGGLKASSVRNYASELSAVRTSLGHPLKSHPDYHFIKMVKRGAANRPDCKPSITEDDTSWSASDIVEFWRRQDDNSALSTERLRAKAISLGLVAAVARPSDLERLDMRTFKKSASAVMLRVWRGKTTGGSWSDHPKTFTYAPASSRRACPASALLDYIDRTAEARAEVPRLPHDAIPVFLALSGLKPITASRISTILQEVFRECGIAARSYSARNRGATFALDSGVPKHLVLQAGGWRSAGTLDAFYTRSQGHHQVGAALFQHPSQQ